MLSNLKVIKLDLLVFFLENKNFFLLSKNFRLSVFIISLFKFFKFYFVKDYKHNYWIFILKEKKFLFLVNSLVKITFFKFLYFYCEFLKFNVFVAIGLGYRKKSSRVYKTYHMSIGMLKWTILRVKPDYFFNARKRSIFFLTDSKQILKTRLNGLKYLKKEVQFKTKGVMLFNRLWVRRHIPRSILFARRIKFHKIKLKLTKKQKQRK